MHGFPWFKNFLSHVALVLLTRRTRKPIKS
jgi:hypothetical protein